MELNEDINGYKVQVFTPSKGVTLPTTYTPMRNEIVILGDDVTITLDGISVDYNASSVIGLKQNVTYTLSVAVNVHKM